MRISAPPARNSASLANRPGSAGRADKIALSSGGITSRGSAGASRLGPCASRRAPWSRMGPNARAAGVTEQPMVQRFGDKRSRDFFPTLRFEGEIIDCEVEGEIPRDL